MKVALSTLFPWILGATILCVGFAFGPILRSGGSPPRIDWTESDVRLGSKINLPQKDVFGRRIDVNSRTLVVFAGSCSGCSLNAIPPRKLYPAKFDQILLLYNSSDRQLRDVFPQPDSRVMMLADSENRLVGALGAQSSPRFYIIEDGRVQDIWKDVTTWPKEWIPEVQQ